jgi:hypothetical protein
VVDPRTERRVVEQRHTERRVERHEHRAARPVRVVRPAPRVVVHTHRPGHVVKVLPSAARRVPWQQQRYHYHEGIWYRPASAGWVVVRPPRGIRVPHLPDFARAVLLGGLVYWVVNDVYYRELDRSQGYEVIDPLAGGDVPGATMQRLFIYPERGQGPEVQATDEYQCHRWAVRQTGFDPTAAVGSGGATQGSPSDYRRAQTACLEARGYSVR